MYFFPVAPLPVKSINVKLLPIEIIQIYISSAMAYYFLYLFFQANDQVIS